MDTLKMKKIKLILGIFSGFLLFLVLYGGSINQSLHVMSRRRGNFKLVLENIIPAHIRTSKEIPIKRGRGKYKLKNQEGRYEEMLSWSQYGQDRFIDKLLEHKRNGTFIEIGGYDGEMFSNTLFLEKERGWTGLLVEANPYTYEQMVRKDRNCFMINSCISDKMHNMTFIIGGGLTSAIEIISKRHQDRIERDFKVYGARETWTHAKENVVVKCYPLSSLMNTLGKTRIDYFSLDVEGAEMIILQSIDWTQLDIDVFTIETDQHRQEILAFMKTHGYKWIQTISGDDVFRKIK